MIQLSERDKLFLSKNGINISKALETDDLDAVLEIIENAIIENILSNHDEPDETGIRLQGIYDRINK